MCVHGSLEGGAGNDVLNGSQGDDQFDGGLGADQLFGGEGADAFVLRAGDGSDMIFDYRKGTDMFLLDGLAFDDLKITQGLGRTTIEIEATNEDLVTLFGVQASSINESDFRTLT
ncbi:MAG: hypothetical protein ACFCU8_01720 [Thermosynechococcaceae cyanobacterium]